MYSIARITSQISFRTVKSQITVLAVLSTIFLLIAGVRAASPGARDLSFGDRGVATYKAGNVFQDSLAIALQPDGKFITVGRIQRCDTSCNYDFLLIRFNQNGTLDDTFGNNGAVIADNFNQNESAVAVALQPDGKIVVIGQSVSVLSQPNVFGFKIMRFLPSGARDTSFGANGLVYEAFDDRGGTAQSMFIQPDGKIVVAGTLNNSTLLMARFNADGGLDMGFGANGRLVTDAYNISDVEILRQPDGKIIVAGGGWGSGSALKIIRFNPNGTVDAGYGTGGVTNLSIPEWYTPTIALQPDGKLIVSGYNSSDNYPTPPLKRLNADGSVDASFVADHGEMVTRACLNCTQHPTKILLLPDGKFYLVGYKLGSNGITAITATRYLSNGTIDRGFGFRGSSQLRGSNLFSFLSLVDAVLQPDGKIAVTTSASSGSAIDSRINVIRMTATVTPPNTRGDFDGDGKTDFAVYRPGNNFWYALNSSDGSLFAQRYGMTGDELMPADYNYDMKTDLSVFRAGLKVWFVSPSMPAGGGTLTANGVGQTGDIPVQADYDGDGQADIAFFSSSGNWTIRYSSRTIWGNPSDPIYVASYHFGLGTDKPVPADYDGDGQADLAVFRPSNGYWYILRSSDGSFHATNFGLGTDKLVPGDYDGDLKTDLAVFREGNWYILRSSDNGFYGINWGLADDKPVPGDYDGDGKFDFAVFRSTTSGGAWYALRSSNSSFLGQYWGLSDDNPIPFTFVK
jgi:uncharacterized delta-60 repeat protein